MQDTIDRFVLVNGYVTLMHLLFPLYNHSVAFSNAEQSLLLIYHLEFHGRSHTSFFGVKNYVVAGILLLSFVLQVGVCVHTISENEFTSCR